MSARRSLLFKAWLLAPVVVLSACSSLPKSLGGTGTTSLVPSAATVAEITSYVQAGVSTLSTVLTTFCASMQPAALATATSALAAVSSAAGAFGASVTAGSSSTTVASTLSSIESLLSAAVSAVVAGLSGVPNPNATLKSALGIAQEVQAVGPIVTAFVNSLSLGAASTAVAPKAASGVAQAHTVSALAIVVP